MVTSDEGMIDIEALVELSERAWGHDYKGRLRVLYDADYYDWLLGGPDWLAVLATNESGQPVGCIFSLLRALSCRGERFPAAYSTGWAVDPAYRRTGISMRMWQAHRLTLMERGYIGISTSHVGHSGTRADVVFRESPGQRGVSVAFHTGVIWSRPLTGKTAAAPARARIDMRRLCFTEGSIDHRTFAELLTSSSPLTFFPSQNFAQMYFNSELTRSGTMWLEPAAGARYVVGYSMYRLALDDMQIGQIGRIQFFLSFDDGGEHAEVVLEEMCGYLQRAGCSSVSLVDQHAIAHDRLERCGFTRTPDEVTFHLWAPEPLAGRFQGLAPPCTLDFM